MRDGAAGRSVGCAGPRAPAGIAPERAPAWPHPPRRPSLTPGQIHVFRACLDVLDDRFQRLQGYLTAEERVRAGRFHHARDARRYTVGRAILRAVLARYLPCAPGGVVIATEASGRPFVPSECRRRPLFFNIAHAGALALIAVTRTGPIGVDVEELYEIAEMEGLADRFFSPEEASALMEVPAELRTAAFFRCWTRKEAVLKATGEGLVGDLRRFEVSLASENARVVCWEGHSGRVSGWNLKHLAPAPGYVGALALRGPLREVIEWSWPSEERVTSGGPASSRELSATRRGSTTSTAAPHAEGAPAAE